MTCPICKRQTNPRYRPFCSKRCADVDLARWFSGAYAIPAREEDDPDGRDVPEAPDAPAGEGGEDR